MAQNFPNLVKETNLQFQEAQRVPLNMKAKRPEPRHIRTKTPKVKSTRTVFFNFKSGSKQKQINLPIYQVGNNYIKVKWKRKNPSIFSYSTFTSQSQDTRTQKNCKENLNLI